MKKVVFLLVVLLTLMPVKTEANDFLVLATSLCENTKVDNKSGIRKALKKHGVKIRRIYDDIKCNDMSLHAFAKANGAEEVAAWYEKKVKKNL
jgi:hypothetical protein